MACQLFLVVWWEVNRTTMFIRKARAICRRIFPDKFTLLLVLFLVSINYILLVSQVLYWFYMYCSFLGFTSHSGPENLKKSRPKKLMKSNNSILRKIFWPNFIFCNFKNDQTSIFELGKSLKTAKNAISRKKNWFHKFFCLDF